jgi:glycerol-1-phosphate dehydrogenase [NAD(P)+]
VSGSPPVALPEVVIAPDAIDQLADHAVTAHWREALVVMDANTREAAGAAVAAALRAAGIACDEHVFGERGGLLAGPEQVEAVRGHAPKERLVAVGSGVITDITRYAAHLEDRPFVSVPTAASMDGYASSMAAMQIRGVKVTYPARSPQAIFVDPRIAAGAPAELTQAGIGDLLAKATARVDWLAAHLLLGEPFCERAATLVLEPLTFATREVGRLVAGEATAAAALLDGLIQSGIAMAIAGDSRPASGCEHHASHFWDLLAARGLRPHASHGLQVGYASHFAMRLQRFAFGGGLSELAPPSPVGDPLGAAARAWLGEPTEDIVAAVADKQSFTEAGAAAWPADAAAWREVRARIAPALALCDGVSDALEQAGIPAEPGFLDLDPTTLRATFRYASRLRARYTVIDFLEGQGALDAGLEAMLTG